MRDRARTAAGAARGSGFRATTRSTARALAPGLAGRRSPDPRTGYATRRGPSGRAVAPVRLSRVRRRPGGGQSGPGVPYTHFPRETPARAKGRNNVPQRSDGDACDDSAIKKRMLLLRRPRAEH